MDRKIDTSAPELEPHHEVDLSAQFTNPAASPDHRENNSHSLRWTADARALLRKDDKAAASGQPKRRPMR